MTGTRLSKHFSLEELCDSETAIRHGIDNTSPPALIPNLRRTAMLHEMIREALSQNAGRTVPIDVINGYRCEALEKMVCAKDFVAWCTRRGMDSADPLAWSTYFLRKAHPKGMALDWRAPFFGSPCEIVEFIAEQPNIMLQVDQIIMEGTWVHCAWSETPRHEILTATFDKNGVPTYTKGVA